MFKSIEYKLVLYISFLIISVSAATCFFINNQYVYGSLCILLGLYSLKEINKHYRKFNKNILFLLNALDNGDYSFHFSESKISQREKELNQIMNRIKDILAKARKEVIENEKFQSLIIESVSTGIIIIDDNNNILASNHAASRVLNIHVLTHLNQLKIIDENLPRLFRDLKPKDNVQIKIANEREETPISIRSSEIKLKGGKMKIITLNNISNELEAKEMESWVRLIRVMTHEIMNSIAPITSLTDTLLFSYKTTPEASDKKLLKENTIDALETISQTARGLISFVESYRKFTGIPKPQPKFFNITTLIEKILHLEAAEINAKNIHTQVIANESIVLNADESQITQVLVNLIKNAIEAIEANNSGEILIKISANESNTIVDICNNGTPISAEVVPHIFIPFFTTKNTGSGIGLSVSRYIMRLHGGNLKHHTKNNWTVFSMAFQL